VCSSDESCDLGTGHCTGPNTTPPGGDAGRGDGTSGIEDGPTGCGCQTGASSVPSLLVWIALAGLLFWRRRRAR
jgi:MYXO-CTERM domain-containing protein